MVVKRRTRRRPRPGPRRASSRKRGGSAAGERLQKYIAGCGHCSRRHAELLIERGLVKVNGQVVQELGTRIVPGRDEVTIHGERISPPRPVTILLNKPAGTITSTHDTHDRLTVMDLLPRKLVEAGVLPAGRLDLDTEGMLVLTNDGDLQHRITHPRYECEKEYKVHLSRPPSDREKKQLEGGIFLAELGKKTADARIIRIRKLGDGTATLHIFIREGMKRQVRRMFESLGIRVLHLDRLAIAGVGIGDLARGEWRRLNGAEVRKLRGPSSRSSAGGRGKKKARRKRKPSSVKKKPARGDSNARSSNERRPASRR